MKLNIRWMIRRDMPEVLLIEQESFEFPWDENDFIRTLRNRDTIALVAEHDQRVLGFIVYQLRQRELRILSLAVNPRMRRKGIGSALVANIGGKLDIGRRVRIFTDVRETNLLAQVFFRAMRFKAVKVLRGWEATGEDAYRFEYRVESLTAKT